MTLNYPGPHQLRIYYTIDASSMGAISHALQLNLECTMPVTPGDPFEDITVERRAAAAIDLDVHTDAFVVLLKALLDADDCTIDYAELWEYASLSFDATYISSYTIGVAGTATGTAFAAAQAIYAFRTTEGGSMSVHLMESNTAAGVSQGYASMNAANKAFVDSFTHVTDAVFLGRDTSFPVAFTRLHPGQNEALFKKRFRA